MFRTILIYDAVGIHLPWLGRAGMGPEALLRPEPTCCDQRTLTVTGLFSRFQETDSVLAGTGASKNARLNPLSARLPTVVAWIRLEPTPPAGPLELRVNPSTAEAAALEYHQSGVIGAALTSLNIGQVGED